MHTDLLTLIMWLSAVPSPPVWGIKPQIWLQATFGSLAITQWAELSGPISMLSMRYLHAQTAARCHPSLPHHCGYACLLCLNSGSVAPLVVLSIMMLRIISCSVKGYTSPSLDMFVSKHHYMVACVSLTVCTLQLQQHCVANDSCTANERFVVTKSIVCKAT